MARLTAQSGLAKAIMDSSDFPPGTSPRSALMSPRSPDQRMRAVADAESRMATELVEHSPERLQLKMAIVDKPVAMNRAQELEHLQVVVKSEIGRLLRYRVRQGIVEGREQEATDRSIRTAVEEVVKALRSFVLHMDTDKLTPHAGGLLLQLSRKEKELDELARLFQRLREAYNASKAAMLREITMLRGGGRIDRLDRDSQLSVDVQEAEDAFIAALRVALHGEALEEVDYLKKMKKSLEDELRSRDLEIEHLQGKLNEVFQAVRRRDEKARQDAAAKQAPAQPPTPPQPTSVFTTQMPTEATQPPPPAGQRARAPSVMFSPRTATAAAAAGFGVGAGVGWPAAAGGPGAAGGEAASVRSRGEDESERERGGAGPLSPRGTSGVPSEAGVGMAVGEEEMDISERIAEEVQRAVKAAEAKTEKEMESLRRQLNAAHTRIAMAMVAQAKPTTELRPKAATRRGSQRFITPSPRRASGAGGGEGDVLFGEPEYDETFGMDWKTAALLIDQKRQMADDRAKVLDTQMKELAKQTEEAEKERDKARKEREDMQRQLYIALKNVTAFLAALAREGITLTSQGAASLHTVLSTLDQPLPAIYREALLSPLTADYPPKPQPESGAGMSQPPTEGEPGREAAAGDTTTKEVEREGEREAAASAAMSTASMRLVPRQAAPGSIDTTRDGRRNSGIFDRRRTAAEEGQEGGEGRVAPGYQRADTWPMDHSAATRDRKDLGSWRFFAVIDQPSNTDISLPPFFPPIFPLLFPPAPAAPEQPTAAVGVAPQPSDTVLTTNANATTHRLWLQQVQEDELRAQEALLPSKSGPRTAAGVRIKLPATLPGGWVIVGLGDLDALAAPSVIRPFLLNPNVPPILPLTVWASQFNVAALRAYQISHTPPSYTYEDLPRYWAPIGYDRPLSAPPRVQTAARPTQRQTAPPAAEEAQTRRTHVAKVPCLPPARRHESSLLSHRASSTDDLVSSSIGSPRTPRTQAKDQEEDEHPHPSSLLPPSHRPSPRREDPERGDHTQRGPSASSPARPASAEGWEGPPASFARARRVVRPVDRKEDEPSSVRRMISWRDIPGGLPNIPDVKVFPPPLRITSPHPPLSPPITSPPTETPSSLLTYSRPPSSRRHVSPMPPSPVDYMLDASGTPRPKGMQNIIGSPHKATWGKERRQRQPSRRPVSAGGSRHVICTWGGGVGDGRGRPLSARQRHA